MATQTKQSGHRRPENAAWYMALIVILAAGLIIWAGMSLRIDHFTEAMKTGNAMSILIAIDDGELPVLSEVLYYHPSTKNGALINIPDETGMLLTAVDRVDRLEALYNPNERDLYTSAVGELLGKPIDFTLRMDLLNFEMLVDLVGGVDIFIPNAIDDTVDDVRYLFPPGGVSLDGAKARSYLEYHPRGEVLVERSEREHRMVQSLLRKIGDNGILLQEEVFPYFSKLIASNLDEKGMSSFISELASVNSDRLVFQGILGNRRSLDGKDVLFPYYDGKLIKETVQRIKETLARNEDFGENLLTVRVEILNGTEVNGLASRTAQIYQSYGFRIASVRNAERDDYERTVILDRRGNPDATRRVAELIRCGQIHSRIEGNRDETVDVTIILGKDFDGRYVKK